MKDHHETWLAQAIDLAKNKRYDDSRNMAMRVVREDGSNVKALWIVANVTDSIPERRNALKALLRVEPDHLPARQMLDAIERQHASLKGTTQMLSPVKPPPDNTAPAPRNTGLLIDRLKGLLGNK